MKTLSDKDILEIVCRIKNSNKAGAQEGAEILLKRWGIRVEGDKSDLIHQWSRMNLRTTNAAKKIALQQTVPDGFRSNPKDSL